MEKQQIRELLDIAVEGADYVENVCEREIPDSAATEILKQLYQVSSLVQQRTEDAEGLLHSVHLYAKNVQASLDEMSGNTNLNARIMSYEVHPFFIEMRRLWVLATEVLPSKTACAERQAQQFQQMKDFHRKDHTSYKYDASIVLTGFNKLEYTKKAAESIFTYTDFSKLNVELITIDNGSSDGTKEYFESLPHEKKIHLKYNIMGVNSYFHIVEGKYIVTFSNDVVATPRWLDNMLAAMESDRRIAIAVPTCNEGSISNDQGIPVTYPNTFAGMEEMQEFANKYNHPNPTLWEQRSILMPFVAIMRANMCLAGLTDPIYTRLEFSDDDLSTLLRRTGWRQMLLKDTFMHHFGGVTLGEGRKRKAGNTLVEMRRVYYEKWGVDAWDSRGGFFGAEIFERWHAISANERVLVLEPRFGDLACELFNIYRHSGHTPHMTAAIFDERYLPDTDYLFDESTVVQHIADLPTQGQYDIISAGCYLDELPLDDVLADLERLYDLLAPDGALILPVRNPACAYELDYIMRTGRRDVYSGAGKVKSYVSISDLQLLQAIHEHPRMNRYKIHTISFQEDVPLVERMKPFLQVDENAVSEQLFRLSVRMFFLGIFKEA